MHEIIRQGSQGGEPVTTQQLVTWLRLDGLEAGDELVWLAAASREMAERYTNRSFMGATTYQETWTQSRTFGIYGGGLGAGFVPSFFVDRVLQAGPITLARGPLLAILSVSADGVLLDPSAYTATGGDTVLPQLLILSSYWQSLQVVYTVGLGMQGSGVDATANLPSDLAMIAMRSIAGHLYANRESQEMPQFAMRLLDLVGKLEA